MTETHTIEAEATIEAESRKAPSGFRVEQAISTWQSARARLLQDDAELARDEAALSELLGEETGDVESILARLLRGAVYAEAQAGLAGEQMENLKARQARFKARGQAMRITAFEVMDAIGRAKVELPDLTASIRKGQQSAMIVDEAAIPDIYVEVVTTRKIDRAVILSTLKSGQEVAGAFLSNGLNSLTIRKT